MSSPGQLRPGFPGERPQTADHVRRAHAVPSDAGKRIPHFLKIGFVPVQEPQGGLALGHDGGERLVDLMGDRRAEFAHRRQPRHSLEVRVRVSQRLFGALAFGDVDCDRAKEGRAPLDRRQKAVDLRPDHAAVLAPVALLDGLRGRLARNAGRDDRLGLGPIVLVGDVGGRKAIEFGLGIADHSLKGRVRRDIASVRTDQADADRHAFEQFAPALLAHHQLAIETGIFRARSRPATPTASAPRSGLGVKTDAATLFSM